MTDKELEKLTKQQAIIISGYTGILMCEFADFHQDVERRLGRPVFTHEMGSRKFADQIKEIYKADLLRICPVPEFAKND